jgi:hypothetical protein
MLWRNMIRLQEYIFQFVSSVCTRWRSWSTVFFSDEDWLPNSLVMIKKMVLGVRWAQAVRYQQFRGKNSSKPSARIMSLFGHGGNIFNIYYRTGWVFVIISEGYHHSASFSRFFHRMLNLQRLGAGRFASGASGGRKSFKQKKKVTL